MYYDRAALNGASASDGPANIHQYDSTTVGPPGVKATIDAVGDLRVASGSSIVTEDLESLVAGSNV